MLARQSTFIITSQLIDGLLAYVALFFITKYMEPETYGIVAFAIGFVSIFSAVQKLGLQSAHIKKIHENNNKKICNGTFFSLKLLGNFISVFLTLGAIWFWTNIMNRGFETPIHETVIYIILFYQVLLNIGGMFTGTFKAYREIACSQSALIVATIVRTSIVIYIAMQGYGAIALAVAYVAGEIAFDVYSFIMFKIRRHSVSKPTKKYVKEYLSFSLPLVLVPIASVLLKDIDKVFIQLFWSSADVGYYTAGYRMTTFLIMIITSVGMLFFPTFAKLWEKNKKEEIKKKAIIAERYISMIVFPAVFGLSLLAEPTTKIFLNQWNETIPILQTLPFYALFLALTLPYQSQFLAMNKPKIVRNEILLMVTVNIMLNIILIPKDIQSIGLQGLGMGATGAVIATIIAYAVGLIYTRIMIYKLTKQKGYPRMIIHIICSLLMSGIVLNIMHYMPIERWYHLLLTAVSGGLVYFMLLIVWKEFTKKDWLFVLDTLNLKKMYSYIKNELNGKH